MKAEGQGWGMMPLGRVVKSPRKAGSATTPWGPACLTPSMPHPFGEISTNSYHERYQHDVIPQLEGLQVLVG